MEAWGWDTGWAEAFAPFARRGLAAARVVTGQRLLGLRTAEAEVLADVAGSLRHQAQSPADLPAVGDWVAVALRPAEGRGTVQAVLPRRSRFVRKGAGEQAVPQVVAANVDTVFLVSGLDHDFNPRRLERYLAVARDSGARPVVLLNKSDLEADPGARRAEVEALAAGVPVVLLSARAATGLGELSPWLHPGRTVALLGSSGVGKSTLVNRLLGVDRQRVLEVRDHDQRGRHATTTRELLRLPGGALVIDTPGMRELHLWDAAAGLRETFAELEELAGRCRFGNCRHQEEPGCAVRAAVEAGTLDPPRLESWRRLQAEQERVSDEAGARQQKKARTRAIHRALRTHKPRE